MITDRLHDQLYMKKYPTRTTNEYNYHWRKTTEKWQEYKKRENRKYYLRKTKSPVSTWDRLEKKKKV
jgi:hypothetical protein